MIIFLPIFQIGNFDKIEKYRLDNSKIIHL